ncbi:5-oxoprolinase subunit PxpB [Hellea sp.]|nr:5-oxoprolinase subunit PxpB [Hellea sp.]
MSVKPPRILPYGDSAVLVDYEVEGYSETANTHLHHAAKALRGDPVWQEIVPSYKSILCVFDLATISMESATSKIEKTLSQLPQTPKVSGKIIEIPVAYGGEFGPDMAAIKKSSGLTQSQIIDTHSGQDYRVCMMGFIPGFCFLSEIPSVLKHPRHPTPRADVPAGSVGIAGWQTGIYGLDSPGGWQIIGRTPLKLFDKTRENLFLMEAGDTIRFIPSSKAIF